MVSIRPKERSETADALPDNPSFHLRVYELHAVVDIYGQLQRYSRPFFWQTNYRRGCNSWVSNWWARTIVRSPSVASNIGIS
jgi:hypothetical protein